MSCAAPDEELETEDNKVQCTPPPSPEGTHEPDSGNDLSSSSLDSHDSAPTSIDLPTEEASPKEVTCLQSPGECPLRPTTIDLTQSLTSEMEKVTGSPQGEVKENGMQICPDTPQANEERKALELELSKCIAEFRKIRIPVAFPNKKRHWQNELLRKYQL